MNHDRAGERARRWQAGVAVAVALFVFVRLRSMMPFYVELHRRAAAAGLPDAVRNLDAPLLTLLAAGFAARLAYGRGGVLDGLGLRRSFVAGVLFATVAGGPMVLQGLWASAGLRFGLDTLRGCVLAPLVEEVFFRGVLVAIPVRCGGLRFWPVAVASSVLFGSMHVPWDASLRPGHLGILAATMAGGMWYAWIARAWGWSLWPTIALHAVMNAAWLVTGVASDAAGGLWANIGRGSTIALGTWLTIRRARHARPDG